MTIKWKRSNDGFCDSKDGKWKITPLYMSCVNPQAFKLTYEGTVVDSMASTQREAKASAEQWLEEQAKQRVVARTEPLLLRESAEATDLRESAMLWGLTRDTENKDAPSQAALEKTDRMLFESALKYGARVILSSDLPPALWGLRSTLADVVAHGFGALALPLAAAGSPPAPAGSTRRSAASGYSRRRSARGAAPGSKR